MGDTIVKPNISKEILSKFQSQTVEERQVTLHCCYKSEYFPEEKIRIWKSTYLIDRHSEHISKLVHLENIALSPDWTDLPFNKEYWFTLIFEGLPKNCKVFDFIELIPEDGGFFKEGILRNDSDVYRLTLD